MKAIFFKGFVLIVLFVSLGFVASAQQIQHIDEEIKLIGIKAQMDPVLTRSQLMNEHKVHRKKSNRINNIQALPVEKRALVRKAALPNK